MASSTSRVSGWTIVGSILIVISIALIIVSEAYPYWQQCAKSRETGIPSVGLWEVCFEKDGWPAPAWANDGLGKRYYGCNYVFDRDLRMIRNWIYPAWFIVVVLFVTLGLLLQPLAIILNILYYVRVVSAHSDHLLLLGSCILNLVTGFLIVVAIFVFGIQAASDRNWMPQPESNHLSYSYGICAFVPVLCFFAATCHTVDFLRLKFYKHRNARANVYTRGDLRY